MTTIANNECRFGHHCRQMQWTSDSSKIDMIIEMKYSIIYQFRSNSGHRLEGQPCIEMGKFLSKPLEGQTAPSLPF